VKIIAIDPGGTTGWAKLEIDTILHGHLREHFSWGHIPIEGVEEHHSALWRFLVHEHPNVIVCERFDNSGDQFTKIVSREYIGIVKLYCQLFDIPVEWQGADVAKNWAPNDRLMTMTLLITPASKWKHANDAMRHLVYWICFKADERLSTLRMLLLELTRS
jgi:hypothetical protein